MNKGWLELESDPGLFTLLVEDFGVQGVQVEEIYDLQKSIEGPVYGFIFLFRWIEERRSRRKVTQEEESFVVDDEITNSMFFAHQVIPNSCATHALLSVLLNCENKIKLGDILTRLKHFTRSMNPEDKGLAIGNMPDLAKAHNSHARPEPCRLPEKQQGISAGRIQEAFHYVSYVPINGHLFELDGLKPHPIDHGPGRGEEDWTETFRRVITERLGMATGGEPYHDIRFNLMAVVPDRRQQYEQKLKTLKTNRQIILEALQQMVKVTSAGGGSGIEPPSAKYSKVEPIVTRSVAAREAAAAAAASLNLDLPDLPSAKQPPRAGRRVPEAASLSSSSADIILPGLDSSSTDVPSVSGSDGDFLSCLSGRTTDSILLLESFSDPVDINRLNAKQLEAAVEADSQVKIHISVSDGNPDGMLSSLSSLDGTDVSKPLVIQTKFASVSSPRSVTGSTTDTASEVASLLSSSDACSSPGSVHSNSDPNPYQKYSVEQSYGYVVGDSSSLPCKFLLDTSNGEGSSCDVDQSDLALDGGQDRAQTEVSKDEKSKGSAEKKSWKKDSSTGQGFTPKDLLSLFKIVESEIGVCETNLRDEVEKRRKYKVDDCRRTHNYDQFICTFLTMLAERGQLASLVEQHMLTKRRQGVSIGRLHKIRKTEKRKRAKRKR